MKVLPSTISLKEMKTRSGISKAVNANRKKNKSSTAFDEEIELRKELRKQYKENGSEGLGYAILKNNQKEECEQMKEVCEFIKIHKKYPTKNSSDPYETVMAKRLRKLRLKPTEACRSVAKDFGYAGLFEAGTTHEHSIRLTDELCLFILKNKRLPNRRASNRESMLARKYNNTRNSIKSRPLSDYSEYHAVAKKHGLEGLFKKSWDDLKDSIPTEKPTTEKRIIGSVERNGIARAEEICKFALKNKRYPKKGRDVEKDPDKYYERSVRRSLDHLIKVRDGKATGTFHESYYQVFLKHGLEKLLTVSSVEWNGSVSLEQLCTFLRDEQRLPHYEKEKLLNIRLREFRKARKGHKDLRYFDSYDEIIKMHGVEKFFGVREDTTIADEKKSEEKTLTMHGQIILQNNHKGRIPESCINKAVELCRFIAKHKRYPAYKGAESVMNRKLKSVQQARKGRGAANYYKEYEEIAERYGLGGLFEGNPIEGIEGSDRRGIRPGRPSTKNTEPKKLLEKDQEIGLSLKNSKDMTLVSEEELPDLPYEEYEAWYDKSEIINGVRMGPKV